MSEFAPPVSLRASRNGVLARVSGFWLLIALLGLVAAGKAIQADTMDPDAFWHLRVADQLLRDGIGPLVDTISFASLKTPWTPYSWLAELLMRAVWSLGFQATALVTAGCSAGILALIAMAAVDATREPDTDNAIPNALGVALLTAVAAYFTLPFISFRPVTFGLLVLAAIVAVLVRDRRRATLGVWAIVPLTVLLTNLHLYSVLVPPLVMLTAAGAWPTDRVRFRRLMMLASATGVAACCTPMLGGAVTTALHYNAVDPMVASNFITEMRPFYTGATGRVALGLFIVLIVLCVIRRRSLALTDWLWLGFATVLLFRLGRFSPVFAIVATPVFARACPGLAGRALERGPVKAVLMLVLVIGAANFWPSLAERDLDRWLNRNAATYPVDAAKYIATTITPHTGRLVNEFNWGGYLAWRLGDRFQVLMDGRTQLYAPAFWKQTHLGDVTSRTALLRMVDADAAVLPAHDSAFDAPLRSLGWHEAYRDGLAVVLIPPG